MLEEVCDSGPYFIVPRYTSAYVTYPHSLACRFISVRWRSFSFLDGSGVGRDWCNIVIVTNIALVPACAARPSAVTRPARHVREAAGHRAGPSFANGYQCLRCQSNLGTPCVCGENTREGSFRPSPALSKLAFRQSRCV